MAHDPSNPFHRMAKTLADRQRNKEQPPAPARALSAGDRKGDLRGPVGKTPASGRGDSPAPADDDGDAALFLDAVSGMLPLRDGGRQNAASCPGRKRDQPSHRTRPCETPGPADPAQSSRTGDPPESGTAFPSRTLADRLRAKPSPSPAQARHNPAGASAAPQAGSDGAAPESEWTGPIKNMRAFFDAMPARDSDETPRDEELLFAKAMRGVSPVVAKGRDVHAPTGGTGLTAPSADPAKALRDLLEGRLEFALHHSDEFMEGHVVGIDPMVAARLRAGQFSPEAHLDLHGQNAVQAQGALVWFIKNAYQRSLRTVLVVTGRGKNSPDGVGVLRPLLPRWLSRDPFKRVVLAFCTAKPSDGGPGAIYVLLRKYKKSRGRILWEHSPSDDDFPDI